MCLALVPTPRSSVGTGSSGVSAAASAEKGLSQEGGLLCVWHRDNQCLVLLGPAHLGRAGSNIRDSLSTPVFKANEKTFYDAALLRLSRVVQGHHSSCFVRKTALPLGCLGNGFCCPLLWQLQEPCGWEHFPPRSRTIGFCLLSSNAPMHLC